LLSVAERHRGKQLHRQWHRSEAGDEVLMTDQEQLGGEQPWNLKPARWRAS
jgi:hypothetical protein